MYINILFFSQFEINKKRDTELTKLRKLLEDVHIESEETAHLLRKKHQEVVADFQEQLDQIAKAKARYDKTSVVILQSPIWQNILYLCIEIPKSVSRTEKEKAKFQQEVYELLAQIENANKEKVII